MSFKFQVSPSAERICMVLARRYIIRKEFRSATLKYMYATRVTLKQINPALVTCRCGQGIQIRPIEEKEDKGTINFAVENVICKTVFIAMDFCKDEISKDSRILNILK